MLNAVFLGDQHILAELAVMLTVSFVVLPVTVTLMYLFRGGSFEVISAQ